MVLLSIMLPSHKKRVVGLIPDLEFYIFSVRVLGSLHILQLPLAVQEHSYEGDWEHDVTSCVCECKWFSVFHCPLVQFMTLPLPSSVFKSWHIHTVTRMLWAQIHHVIPKTVIL